MRKILNKDAVLKQFKTDLKFISLRLNEMKQNDNIRKLKRFTDRCLNDYNELYFE